MSNLQNDIYYDNLKDRAYEVLEECTNHPSGLDRALSEEIQKPTPNLDRISDLVTQLEGLLAQAHFYERGIIEPQEIDCV